MAFVLALETGQQPCQLLLPLWKLDWRLPPIAGRCRANEIIPGQKSHCGKLEVPSGARRRLGSVTATGKQPAPVNWRSESITYRMSLHNDERRCKRIRQLAWHRLQAGAARDFTEQPGTLPMQKANGPRNRLQQRTNGLVAKILNARVRFIEGDFLDHTDLGKFDLVVMVRVLTCFSQLADWRALLTRSLECVAPGALLYVHDFLFTPENDSYRERYRKGTRQGWRTGNFAVPAKDGGLLFIAHHHSGEDLSEIMSPYEKIFLNMHDSVSLNGNACRMFEFLGKRKAAA